MRSKRNTDIVDQLIELRIALEALYLPSGSEGARFHVSNHGAWHLGVDFAERREFQKVLRDAYDAASRAVHTGTVEPIEVQRALLVDAQSLCRKGILKRMDEDEVPNWSELILGKDA